MKRHRFYDPYEDEGAPVTGLSDVANHSHQRNGKGGT